MVQRRMGDRGVASGRGRPPHEIVPLMHRIIAESYTGGMLQATGKIWCNGKFIAWDDAKIHVLSHVVSYGSSVFEGIRCYETATGPAIFRLREHVRRLVDSAKVYRMDTFAFSQDELVDAMIELVD